MHVQTGTWLVFFQNDKLVVLFYESDDRDADEIIEGLEGNFHKNDFNSGPFPKTKKTLNRTLFNIGKSVQYKVKKHAIYL